MIIFLPPLGKRPVVRGHSKPGVDKTTPDCAVHLIHVSDHHSSFILQGARMDPRGSPGCTGWSRWRAHWSGQPSWSGTDPWPTTGPPWGASRALPALLPKTCFSSCWAQGPRSWAETLPSLFPTPPMTSVSPGPGSSEAHLNRWFAFGVSRVPSLSNAEGCRRSEEQVLGNVDCLTIRQTCPWVFRDAAPCGFHTGTGSDSDNFIKSQGLLAASGSNNEEMHLAKNACGKAEPKL